MMPKYWKVLLEGYGDSDTGDVITRDGEIIGTWSLVDDVFSTFTPNGATEYLYFEPFLGELCAKIAKWQEEHESLQPSLSDS